MKQSLTFFVLLLASSQAISQNKPPFFIPDTLLIEQVINDPVAKMLPLPSGYDTAWVNFDGDGHAGLCADGDGTPTWFTEVDFGDSSGANTCLTSCSFFEGSINSDLRADNWLITPAISIPNNRCILQWKSATFQGPAFLDGYDVVISRKTNDLFSGAFQDTVFRAASMEDCLLADCSGLNLANFTFSPGYIHADGFKLTQYFKFDSNLGANAGFLEPHHLSLADYANDTIFIAFVHNSSNNFLLQLDDILVINSPESSTQTLTGSIAKFGLAPNPTLGSTRVRWELMRPEPATLSVYSVDGTLLSRTELTDNSVGEHQVDLSHYPTGAYFLTLTTPSGQVHQRLIKL